MKKLKEEILDLLQEKYLLERKIRKLVKQLMEEEKNE